MRVDADVYMAGNSFAVNFTADGVVFDTAEGFDSEIEAVDAARRGVYGIGTVYVHPNQLRFGRDQYSEGGWNE